MLHNTHNTLTPDVRAQSVMLLNRHLAAAIDLHAQVKQAHWNVRGANFIAVHQLFDNVSVAVKGYADMFAERAGGLGGEAHGTLQSAVAATFLVPYPLGLADAKSHIFAVSAALAGFGQSVRDTAEQAADFGDLTTSDLFTEVSRSVDQQLWLVESHSETA
jgi:starvation-inducible DNA-binding protein